MRYVKIFLWVATAILFVVGLFKDGVTNFTDMMVLIILGTLLFISSIEYKKNKGKDIRFYTTFICAIIAYILAGYMILF